MTRPNHSSDQREFIATIDAELYETVIRLRAERHMTRNEMLTRALVLLLDELCEPVPLTSRRRIEQGNFEDRRGKWKRPPRKPLFPEPH